MDPALDELTWQFDMAWRLGTAHILPHLTDDACLWSSSAGALTVRPGDHGTWQPDWIEDESWPQPETTVAWLTWHLQWWLGNAIAEMRGQAPMARHDVAWPGSADGVRSELSSLAAEWRDVLADLEASDLDQPTSAMWEGPPWPRRRLVAWVNMELMKNIAEIGQVARRHAHATSRL